MSPAAKGKNHQALADDAPLEDEIEEAEEGVSINYIIFTLIVGLLLLLNWLGIFKTVLGIDTAIILTLVGGYKIFLGALESLFRRKISVDLAIALAAIAALSIKQYLAAAEVMFIMLVGEALESFAVDRTRGAIKKLIDLSPKKARVVREGKEQKIEVERLVAGDRVIVKPGERIPVDGEVLSGYSSVDQSTITGESIPVEKSAGSKVYSGTINQLGSLEIRAEKVGEDTLLSRIIHLVEEAQSQKAPIQKVADRYAKFFVPIIILVAAISWLITRDLVRSVSILIIACPCALVLATPTAIFAGIGRMAKEGILVKGGAYLEAMGRVGLIALDKTGTLTQGKPRLVSIIPFQEYSEQQVLSLAALAEQHSEHLLARIVVEEAKRRSVDIGQCEHFLVKPGLGVEAVYQGKRVFVGSRKLLQEEGIEFDAAAIKVLEEVERKGQTIILISCEQKLAGAITMQDEIRPEAIETIRKLKKLGLKLTLLTGDNELVAKQIAHQAGIDEYAANLLPDGKVDRIRKWQEEGYVVAMVGDGINDAPSLTAANVGIAMGSIGSDIAIDAADMIFMADDLSRLENAVVIGRKTVKTIRQNIIFFAVIFNTLAVVAAAWASAWVTPPIAAIVHQISSLLVVGNSLRLLSGKIKDILTGWLLALIGWSKHLVHDHIRSLWENYRKPIVNTSLALVIVLYLFSGLTMIAPYQRGVVQRFGRLITDNVPPGLHLFFPWPIDKVTKVIRSVDRVEIGFRRNKDIARRVDQKTGQVITTYEWDIQDRSSEYQKKDDETLVFTGDENFLELDLVVQYRVKDPSAYLFKIRGLQDTENLVRFCAQSAIREIIGQKGADQILTTDRSEIEARVSKLLQQEFDSLDTGLLVTGAYLQSVHPPIEVADSFRAVVNAHEEKSMLINLAEAYHNEQLPLAHGKGEQNIRLAEAYRQEIVNRAEGEGERFVRMCENYDRFQEATTLRLYLETVESVLPGMKKFILDEQRNGREELTVFGSKKIETLMNNLTREFFPRAKQQNLKP
ncbi:MAG: cadmium-translocating P-type ATPase [bacterium]|nr:cadmium-translocating P-type ATPase [bacterium]